MTQASYTQTWNGAAVEKAATLTAMASLRAIASQGFDLWEGIVPIETGLLDISFRTKIRGGKNPVLDLTAGTAGAGLEATPEQSALTGPPRFFGSTRLDAIARIMARMGRRIKTAGAYYAFWVETGWTAPNGRWVTGQFPLTRTGLALARLLPSIVAEQSAKRGLGRSRSA